MVTPPRGRFWPIVYCAVSTAVIIAVLIPVVGYTGYILWGFYELLFNYCATTEHRTVPSPDLSRVAIVFDIDCGATTDFNTQVSIVGIGDNFSPDRNPSILSIRGQRALYMRWVSDKILEVSLPQHGRIYRKDDHAGDVEIQYRTMQGIPWRNIDVSEESYATQMWPSVNDALRSR